MGVSPISAACPPPPAPLLPSTDAVPSPVPVGDGSPVSPGDDGLGVVGSVPNAMRPALVPVIKALLLDAVGISMLCEGIDGLIRLMKWDLPSVSREAVNAVVAVGAPPTLWAYQRMSMGLTPLPAPLSYQAAGLSHATPVWVAPAPSFSTAAPAPASFPLEAPAPLSPAAPAPPSVTGSSEAAGTGQALWDASACVCPLCYRTACECPQGVDTEVTLRLPTFLCTQGIEEVSAMRDQLTSRGVYVIVLSPKEQSFAEVRVLGRLPALASVCTYVSHFLSHLCSVPLSMPTFAAATMPLAADVVTHVYVDMHALAAGCSPDILSMPHLITFLNQSCNPVPSVSDLPTPGWRRVVGVSLDSVEGEAFMGARWEVQESVVTNSSPAGSAHMLLDLCCLLCPKRPPGNLILVAPDNSQHSPMRLGSYYIGNTISCDLFPAIATIAIRCGWRVEVMCWNEVEDMTSGFKAFKCLQAMFPDRFTLTILDQRRDYLCGQQ